VAMTAWLIDSFEESHRLDDAVEVQSSGGAKEGNWSYFCYLYPVLTKRCTESHQT
jgi:hypothetical protein